MVKAEMQYHVPHITKKGQNLSCMLAQSSIDVRTHTQAQKSLLIIQPLIIDGCLCACVFVCLCVCTHIYILWTVFVEHFLYLINYTIVHKYWHPNRCISHSSVISDFFSFDFTKFSWYSLFYSPCKSNTRSSPRVYS